MAFIMGILTREGSVAKLTTFLIDGPGLGTVLIIPGGGYGFVSPREAIAAAYNKAGYNAFVLEYSVAENTPTPLSKKPLADAAWAISLIRENSSQHDINPDKIAVCGFSAGGHLTASLAAYWSNPGFFGGNKSPEAYRPNAVLLCYAVLSAGMFRHDGSFVNLAGSLNPQDLAPFSMEWQISPLHPPAFLWSTGDDEAVPVQNSLLYALKLSEYQIPYELHVFPHGPHGLSLATKEVEQPEKNRFADPYVARWFDMNIEWLKATL